jgi:hypothetical protein
MVWVNSNSFTIIHVTILPPPCFTRGSLLQCQIRVHLMRGQMVITVTRLHPHGRQARLAGGEHRLACLCWQRHEHERAIFAPKRLSCPLLHLGTAHVPLDRRRARGRTAHDGTVLLVSVIAAHVRAVFFFVLVIRTGVVGGPLSPNDDN